MPQWYEPGGPDFTYFRACGPEPRAQRSWAHLLSAKSPESNATFLDFIPSAFSLYSEPVESPDCCKHPNQISPNISSFY